MADEKPELRTLTPDELPGVIARARDEGWHELALLGLGPVRVFQYDALLKDGWDPRFIFGLEERLDAEGAAALASLTKVTSLDLVGNMIGDEGAAALASLTNLTSLNLRSNRIGAEGAAALASLTKLTSLDLWDNRIGAEGAAALGSLTNLTSLNLGHNSIGDEGAAALASLTNLTSLNLASNSIGDQGAAALVSLTNLTSLNLGYNSISAAGAAALASLTSLTSLNLGHNSIGDEGAAALSSLTNLTSLNLQSSRIGDKGAAALGSLTNLTSLNLLDNVIGDEGAAALASLTKLTSLDLRWNRIGDEGAAALSSLTNLTSLNLYDNRIGAEGAAALTSLTNLTSLSLAANNIGAEGAAALASLTNLTSLDFYGNNIGDEGLSALANGPVAKKLRSLRVAQNNIKNLPPELIEQGDAQAIFAAVTGRPLNEAKVLVVGEPEVGKTRLVGWLIKGKDPGPPTWTRGVKIARWPIPVDEHESADTNEDGQTIQANVWDFGGQEIMQATHQFFLTERSLYLLVLDARHNDEQSRVRHWLEKISAFGGDSPVIVVMNKQDVGSMKPDESRLRQDYEQILLDDFYPTSCETGDGMPELRTAIEARIGNLDHVRSRISAAFLATKTALEEEASKEKHLSRDDYERICNDHGVTTDQDRQTLLETLKALGTVYHYQDARHPRDTASTYVLDPEWVTRGVYGVLTSPVLKDDDGVLDTGNLARYFEFDEDGEYPEDKQQFILGMMTMDQFELAFPMPDQPGHYLVPEQLPTNEIAHHIEREDSLNFEFKYAFLPAGVIPRLIVRMHHAMERGGVWRNGVVLELEDCRVLVRASREEGRVFICVSGPQDRRRAALACARVTLGEIHGAMKHLRPTALVPLPDNLDVTHPYDDLRELERDPEAGPDHRLKPPGATRWYTVRELLEGVDDPAATDRSETGHPREPAQQYAAQVQDKTNEPPDTIQQGFMRMVWASRWGKVIVIALMVCGALFAVWCSLPEDTQKDIIQRITGGDSAEASGSAPPAESASDEVDGG